MIKMHTRGLALAAAISSPLLLNGCATTALSDDHDPLEDFNRVVHGINTTLDEGFVKPAAEAYKLVAPPPVDRGITNFFSNLGDIGVFVNDLLQFKFGQAASDLGRFAVNSTAGIFGLIDVATPMGLEKHNEDLGQTLGYWGFGPGPYIVLPILGPSNLRDAVGFFGDSYLDPVRYLDDPGARNALRAVKYMDIRADLLSATSIVDTAALDQYAFVRDAYLQRRNFLVHDGEPPEEDPTN